MRGWMDRTRVGSWIGSFAGFAALTVAMVTVRGSLDKAHVALGYLLLVLWGSARAGRALGVVLALVGFVFFNFLFLPPFHTFVIHDPLDWFVLFAYLMVALVAAQLLARAQREAAEAHRRAEEINRLSVLGAETLNAGRAEEALHAITEVIRATLGVRSCEIYLAGEEGRPEIAARDAVATPIGTVRPASVGQVLDRRVAVLERTDGTTHLARVDGKPGTDGVPVLDGTRAVSLPLLVRDRVVGVLRISSDEPIALTPAQRRFFAALSYYAALGAERVRLGAEAERAEALREADRLKDALLASVSHDLRTPLTTIKALAHDLAQAGEESAVTIEEEADRLNRLVANLLDLSRLNAGALRMEPELVAVDDLLGAALQRVTPSLQSRELVTKLDPAEPLMVGRCDFVQSLRVLVNLVENAHKYAPPDTAIEIDVRRIGDRVVFRVMDRGPGIPESEAERVFEPFRQLSGVSPEVGGAGLGLSIARRLAEAQNGALWYEPRPGGGSTFSFALPAADLDPNRVE